MPFCSKWSCPGQTRAAEVLWLHSPQMLCRTVRQRWTPWWARDVGPLTDSWFEACGCNHSLLRLALEVPRHCRT